MGNFLIDFLEQRLDESYLEILIQIVSIIHLIVNITEYYVQFFFLFVSKTPYFGKSRSEE